MNNELVVRHAVTSDFCELERVYSVARSFMKQTGNPTQWGNVYPQKNLLEKDIARKELFVVEQENKIVGVFMFFIGEEPCYKVIEDGNWHADKPYGTIHRVASDGSVKGIFSAVFKFSLGKIDHLRIDTHQDNKVMQNTLIKHGFKPCGRVYMQDGTPRIAFDYIKQ